MNELLEKALGIAGKLTQDKWIRQESLISFIPYAYVADVIPMKKELQLCYMTQ